MYAGAPGIGDGFGGPFGGPYRGGGQRFVPGFARGSGGYGYGGGYAQRPGALGVFDAAMAEVQPTPEQYRAIVAAVSETRTAALGTRGELAKSRDDVARAVKSEVFDEAALGEAFARQDEHVTEVRKALIGSLAKIHEVLAPEQRARLSAWLQRTPGAIG